MSRHLRSGQRLRGDALVPEGRRQMQADLRAGTGGRWTNANWITASLHKAGEGGLKCMNDNPMYWTLAPQIDMWQRERGEERSRWLALSVALL